MSMDTNEPFDLAVKGRLALPGASTASTGWMGIQNGRIATISGEPLKAKKILDVGSHLVLPGFVDAHVHCRSCLDEGITATTTAAAAGGTTTLIDMPFDKPDRPVNTSARLNARVPPIG